MEAKYKVDDEVTVSGTLTGIGDIKGQITEVKFEPLADEYFYVVKSPLQSFWSQERFLSKID